MPIAPYVLRTLRRLVRASALRSSPGFSLLELLVVLAILGGLVAVAAPAVMGALGRANETVLRENLAVMRSLIDDYNADRGENPPSLQALVDEGYLRAIPPDPLAGGRTEWNEVLGADGGIENVRSLGDGTGRDGVPYAQW